MSRAKSFDMTPSDVSTSSIDPTDANYQPSSSLDSVQEQINELSKQNGFLTKINEDQTLIIKDLANNVLDLRRKFDNLQNFNDNLLKILIPSPVNLSYMRHDKDSLIVTWDNIIPLLSMVAGYKICLNDVPSGIVLARNKRFVISNIDNDVEYKLSIEAFSKFNNVHSLKAVLFIPKAQDDKVEDKENLTETNESKVITDNA